MSLLTIRARLRRLEQARQAHDTRPPQADEMRQAILDPANARPAVLAMLAKFRAYAREVENNTHGFCPMPEPRP